MNTDDETKRPQVDGRAELPAEPHASSSIMGRKRSSCPSKAPHVSFNIDSPPRVASYSSMSNVSTATDVVVPAFVHDSNFTQIFVELYDLNLSDPKNVDGIWCETARWIKYEEDVEGVEKHRWGRPHVPLLSFHALNLLPKMIQNGIVMLNSKARNYVEVCDSIAKAMSEANQCNVDSERIKKLLMLNHNHVTDRRMSRISSMFFDRFDQQAPQRPPGRSRSAAPFPQHSPAAPTNGIHLSASTNSHLNAHEEHDSSLPRNPMIHSAPLELSNQDDVSPTAPPMRNRSISAFVRNKLGWSSTSRPAQLEQYKNDFVLRNLPKENIESAQVFTGVFPQLHKIRFVMVRLERPVLMPELVDGPIPVRFIFLILGPPGVDVTYHELGRAVCTLMSNPSFNALAYKAQNNEELIKAFDCFLDGSVVIPPGEVDSIKLISGHEIKKALKRRPMEKEMNRQKPEANGNAQNGGQKRYHMNGNGIRPVISGGDPPGDEPPKRKFRFFNGLVEDVKNRMPLYGSDFRDACNFQCLTSVIFMFLASVAPAITFGGLLGKRQKSSYTNEKIGTIETLFAQCICGVIWGLFAAQPLLIMSATGPVLVFETSLYVTCETLGLEFMTVRLYAGIFIFVISLLITAVDGSRLLVFVTRFTEDIFATLISLIFIAESLSFVHHTFRENPVENFLYYETAHAKCGEEAGLPVPNLTFTPLRNVDPLGRLANRSLAVTVAKREVGPNGTDLLGAAFNLTDRYRRLLVLTTNNGTSMELRPLGNTPCLMAEPNTALLTAIIMFSTFALAFLLKKLRESFYLGRTLRRALGDFGVLIAIAFVAVIAQHYIPDPYLARLEMPDELNFTNPAQRGHGLVIVPTVSEMDWKAIVVALVAALLVFILLYVETEITELLLARKERGCRKGSGMNWDLVLLGFCSLLCSIFGLPWMCAAAVQSLAHCSSLTVMKKKAPGAKMGEFSLPLARIISSLLSEVEKVHEQRVTTILISLLMGLFAFAGSYLRLPLASLFGVFLYLGVMNLCGVQLMHRIVLFFVPAKYFPQKPYTELVGVWRMHSFTIIQIGLLLFVYIVKHFKRTALLFPFVLMLFIVFRQLVMPKIFSEKELKALDGEDDEEQEWCDDFNYQAPIPV